MTDWKECLQKKLVKSIKEDEELIKSLLKSSENKLKSQELLPLNETTTSAKISLAYDALRELLEALATIKGYKIYNHECYTAFLKEIIKKSSLGDDFDELRKTRNAINYYGKEINIQETKETIQNTKQLIKMIKHIFEEE